MLKMNVKIYLLKEFRQLEDKELSRISFSIMKCFQKNRLSTIFRSKSYNLINLV